MIDPRTGEKYYLTSDVRRILKITSRKLQCWDECGIVMPRQEGHRRTYTALDMVTIRMIMGLQRKGISLQRARRVVKELRRFVIAQAKTPDLGVPVLLDLPPVYVVTNAACTRVKFEADPLEVCKLLAAADGQRAVLWLEFSV